MQLDRIEDRSQSPFITAYQSGSQAVSHLYDWSNADTEKYRRRLQNIKSAENSGQVADRQSIAELFVTYHQRLAMLHGQATVAATVDDNIARYALGAVTIVTGQQAGIGTGPLYTINKIISLLKSTVDLQEQLREPVVPVFWIAGEDHDIDEIDHLYINTRERLQRVAVDWSGHKPRNSVSNVFLTREQVGHLLGELQEVLRDSQYKESILNALADAYKECSLSTAFAVLLYKMFAPFGLLLFDAHDAMVREQERPMFAHVVELVEDAQRAYQLGFQAFTATGYTPLIAIDGKKTGLYIDLYEKRQPILYDDGEFYIEGLTKRFSKEQLLTEIADKPQQFSTNVLLRTIMQEYLFQPLMYIGGAAEVQYWGQMKPLFHLFGYRMPIVALRNSYTYVAPALQAKLAKYDIDALDVLARKNYDYEHIVSRFIDQQYDLSSLFDSLRQDWQAVYQERLQTIPDTYVNPKAIEQNSEHTWGNIVFQLSKMQQSLEKTHNERHKELKADIRWIGNELLPHGTLQERVLNVYQFTNLVGTDFLAQIIYNGENWMDGGHYLVRI